MTANDRLTTLLATAALAVAVGAAPAAPQDGTSPRPSGEGAATDDPVARGIDFILAHQEGDGEAEWPYEGVYRVAGRIPIGYRVGGTAISAAAMIRAPGYAGDERRRTAVRRATDFIARSVEHADMAHEFESRYDVRGWGYAYGLAFLIELKMAGLVPEDQVGAVETAVRFFIDGITKTAIPEVGGWAYARSRGFAAPGPPSPFMTGPTLQALFAAKAQGYAVDDAAVERAIGALEAARTPTGAFTYSGAPGLGSRESVPGSVGRMLVGESTLLLAGRSSVERVRAAIDAFIVHWQWLEKRRAQEGTHAPPYGIAPYYFYYAHYQAASAVTFLPAHERREYRRRIDEILMSTRAADGSWNDRVFPRSAAYGTAMAVLSLLADEAPAPARWEGTEDDGAAELKAPPPESAPGR